MSWRLKRSEFEKKRGPGDKAAFKKIVATGPSPGVLAYSGGEPVGWCAVAREVHERFENSRILTPVDDQPAWSLTCFLWPGFTELECASSC